MKAVASGNNRPGQGESEVAAMTTPAAQHVVVGVDGSTESVHALRWAASYASATGASVTAMLSWHYPSAVGTAPGYAPREISAEVRESMQEVLDKATGEVFGSPAPASVTTKVAYGHPANTLVEESEHADLLVVGNRGHGKFTGMLVGSVSIHCVSHALCPVVVVRGKE
jgi:nucleotide-binding universal stress UspA family protein